MANLEVNEAKELFLKYFGDIKREGSGPLLKWLCSTDFFSAPASTRFHGNIEGGLVIHSVNAYQHLVRLVNTYKSYLGIESWKDIAEKIAIVSLLHDACKIGCYKTELRNRKNEAGQWEKYPVFTFDEDEPMGGHGFKSVFLIEEHMKLTREEQVAIACHMGPYDRNPGDYSLTGAFEKYPLAFLLHTADCAATFMDEKKEDQ